MGIDAPRGQWPEHMFDCTIPELIKSSKIEHAFARLLTTAPPFPMIRARGPVFTE